MAPHADDSVESQVDTRPQTPTKPEANGKQKSKGTGKGKGKGKKKAEQHTKERIQRLDQIYSKKKRENYFVPTPKSKANPETANHASHVVLKVRRIICDKGFPTGTEIDIKSEILTHALSEIYDGVEGTKLNEYPPEISPELLFHAGPGLIKRVEAEQAKETPNQTAIEEIGIALQYIAEDFESTTNNILSLSQHDEITFDLLWTLFPPNTPIYSRDNLLKDDQVFKLQQGTYECRNGSKFFAIKARCISHDGENLGWVDHELEIADFVGARKVQNLPYFPLKYHSDPKALSSELIERGKKFLDMTKATYMEYNGPAIAENQEVYLNNQYKRLVLHATGRIMLDPTTCLQQNTSTELLWPKVERELTVDRISESDFIFCNHCAGGFSFRQKKWCLFSINRMAPVVWNTNAFSKLVMDKQKRDLIHTLVRSHKNSAETFDDIVSGKGKGLVGLLSGNPGVGKTLTAEVIAEATKRPLYMLSAGELGTYTGDVERSLDQVLEITRQWGCVLLIDEADVFLQERDGLDLERNALVSIFLRRLEYFQGVLIMTTNRKRTIDAAFDSRIHFKLHYPDLSVASRASIWKNCLENAPAAAKQAKLNEQEITQLAEVQLNGRQIKNAVACAVSIALEEKKALTVQDIRVILDMVVDADTDEKIGSGK
ncbi:P-loop containing nucleoside triphosphate hydrolase protein [Aaosphaeria arxii CBS 175.79]|uniref:P-loop containing nucleoside triphosphate hydrolase protein n=1 Tax=Aaosphaeria arxii CBS 175.79 TaxID=1450172 RepID=A0A6A5XEW9_9PLEO|nr:P-loop containing nucleoside triphosphate hydrolase protein [Aaosphaeria arxii CBS 175.79]KAF2011401.1 P-loop containing nucleoside triphosphate hydrolase protein [Aaosphaeria arxii CBS 175.79]